VDAAGRAGHPGVCRPPYVPSGVPPAEHQRGAARVQTLGSCLFAAKLMIKSDHALGEAQGDSLVVDIGCVGRVGDGQTDPGNHVTAKFRSHRGPLPTTNPLGPRTTEPVGSVNLSPDSRSGMAKPSRSKGLALTAHIGTYALPTGTYSWYEAVKRRFVIPDDDGRVRVRHHASKWKVAFLAVFRRRSASIWRWGKDA
jgi:hypothetical protein